MKRVLLIFVVIAFKIFSDSGFVQIPELGSNAPSFKTITNRGIIDFPEAYVGKWVVFFSFPCAFTPVCTSEMKAILKDEKFFKDKNCELVGLTFNSVYDQSRWLNQLKRELDSGSGLILIPDVKKSIAKQYGMYHPIMSEEKAMRTLVIIDPSSKVRAILIYPMLNGRNIAEIKRLVMALQLSDIEKKATPANWKEGDVLVTCKKCKPPKEEPTPPKK